MTKEWEDAHLMFNEDLMILVKYHCPDCKMIFGYDRPLECPRCGFKEGVPGPRMAPGLPFKENS
jgi:hypothetical protein